MARDLAALLEAIGAEQIDLVGYSMGAIVALLLASEEELRATAGRGRRRLGRDRVRRRRQAHRLRTSRSSKRSRPRIRPRSAIRERCPSDSLRTPLGGDSKALAAQARSVFRGEIALRADLCADARPRGGRGPARSKARGLCPTPSRTPPCGSSHGNHIGAIGDPALQTVHRRLPRRLNGHRRDPRNRPRRDWRRARSTPWSAAGP